MNFEELQAFAGRNPILSLAFVGLTIAIVVTETALLFRRYTALKPADLTRLINSENALVVDLSPSSDFEKDILLVVAVWLRVSLILKAISCY